MVWAAYSLGPVKQALRSPGKEGHGLPFPLTELFKMRNSYEYIMSTTALYTFTYQFLGENNKLCQATTESHLMELALGIHWPMVAYPPKNRSLVSQEAAGTRGKRKWLIGLLGILPALGTLLKCMNFTLVSLFEVVTIIPLL